MSEPQVMSEAQAFDPTQVRKDFPILSTSVHDQPLVYLDNAATSQKPQHVIDRMTRYYQQENANVHRGLHYLSETATAAMEHTRDLVQTFINANKREEIIFTSGCTEGLNMLAYSLSAWRLQPGDQVLISAMEHHANIVPWQLACERTGAELKVIPVLEDGSLDMVQAEQMLTEQVKILSLVHVSNTLGTINPIEHLTAMAQKQGALVVIDGAQAITHMRVDVQALNCDFYVFSGHKMIGPTGSGIVYGKQHWLEQMPPFLSGGDMIETVAFDQSTFAKAPAKFEAGTPNIAAHIGLGAAIEYLNQLDFADVHTHEQQLLDRVQSQLAEWPGIQVLGSAANKVAVCSFYCEHVHPHDLSTLLDLSGIAVRAGHHCTMPLMQFYQVPASIRVSFAFYNTLDEADYFLSSLDKTIKSF